MTYLPDQEDPTVCDYRVGLSLACDLGQSCPISLPISKPHIKIAILSLSSVSLRMKAYFSLWKCHIKSWAFRDGADTSSGREFQAFTTLTLKKFCLIDVVMTTYQLRDKNNEMVDQWKEAFEAYSKQDSLKISHGDIFEGAPAADAVVMTANSFGFMDGGIGAYYKKHFGQHLYERAQDVIQAEYDGELLVGQAEIILAYDNYPDKIPANLNMGIPIKYVIIAPTMRVPLNVSNTPNSYLTFRAVILAVNDHNANPNPTRTPIKTVLVPGLGTANGKIPARRCAHQMLQAYESFVKGKGFRRRPDSLKQISQDHSDMTKA